MREVKVNKTEALAKIKENLTNHIKEHEEAVEGYKTEATNAVKTKGVEVSKALKQLLVELETNAVSLTVPVSLSFGLRVPQSHEKDYRQVIAMLEMCVDEVITLQSDQFACYIMDDWDWKEDFAATNALYKKAR